MISFDPYPVAAPALIVLGLATGWVLWKERMREVRWKRIRLIAVGCMALGLALCILRPERVSEQKRFTILLTANYGPAVVDSLLNIHSDAEVLRLMDAQPYPRSRSVSVDELVSAKKQMSYLLGNGLPAAYQPAGPFQFIPGPQPDGILDIELPSHLYAQQENNIGIYYYTTHTGGMLRIPGIDSASLRMGYQREELTIVPRETGYHTFPVEMKSDVNQRDTLRVFVYPPEKFRILIIEGFPTAEAQTLKRFLASEGHQVVVRTRLSSAVYKTEHINTTPSPIDFEHVDLFIIQNQTLSSLSLREQKLIDEEVRKGKGLLVPFTSSGNANSDFIDKRKSIRYTHDTITYAEKDITHPLKTVRLELRKTDDITPLLIIRDHHFSGYWHHGKGRIGVQLLRDTYTQLLRGDSAAYSTIWSGILKALSKKYADETILLNPISIEKTPVPIQLMSTSPHPALYMDSLLLPIKEDAVFDNRWSTSTWFPHPGWYILRYKDGMQEYPVYAYSISEWTGIQRHQTLRACLQNSQVAQPTTFAKTTSLIWIGWTLFLLGGATLWLAPKI